MKRLTKALILSASLLITSAQVSAFPDDVIQAYQAGLAGDAEANQEAIQKLQTIFDQDKTNIVALALLGSSETAKARYTDRPWQKMKLSEKGMAKLDKAVRMAIHLPTELQARVITTAGCTYVKVPKLFNRLEQGSKLLDRLIAEEKFTKLDTKLKLNTYMCALHAAKSLEQQERVEMFVAEIQKIAPAMQIDLEAEKSED